MGDPEVRQDELKRPTTVEHVKLLRDRLEEEIKGHIDENMHTIKERVRKVEAEREKLLLNLSRMMEKKLEDVSQKLEEKWKDVNEKLEALAK